MWGLSWELLGYWLLPRNISAVSEMVLVKTNDKEDWWLLCLGTTILLCPAPHPRRLAPCSASPQLPSPLAPSWIQPTGDTSRRWKAGRRGWDLSPPLSACVGASRIAASTGQPPPGLC
ncbi:hypothetical protein H8957_011961, partial [Semnopithecus entellus]